MQNRNTDSICSLW